MPYEIQMDNKECEGHAVVKLDDGFIMGCHKTHEEAEKQLQAILINEAKQKEEKSLYPHPDRGQGSGGADPV